MFVIFISSVYIMTLFLVYLEVHPTYSKKRKKKKEKISIKSCLFSKNKNKRYLQIINYVELMYSLFIILLYFIADKPLLNKFLDGWLILISVVFLLLEIESDKTTDTLIEKIIYLITPIIIIVYSIINFTTGSINVIIRFLT